MISSKKTLILINIFVTIFTLIGKILGDDSYGHAVVMYHWEIVLQESYIHKLYILGKYIVKVV